MSATTPAQATTSRTGHAIALGSFAVGTLLALASTLTTPGVLPTIATLTALTATIAAASTGPLTGARLCITATAAALTVVVLLAAM